MIIHFSTPAKSFIKTLSLAFILTTSVFVARAQTPIITTFAGTSPGYSGDGGLATAAQLNQPSGMALDAAGNVYIADSYNNVIRKVAVNTGIITTFAGNGSAGYSGDGGQATSAQLNAPQSVAIDANNNLYIGDWNNSVIRKVNIASGIITTFAGTGVQGYSGDGGPAISAELNLCSSVALDNNGNVYISDDNNNVIRKVDNAGIITTFAGTGTCGYSGDGGQASAAAICFPLGMQNDSYGNLYISDIGNAVVRKIDIVTGIITTVAGNGTTGYSGDGGPATSAQLDANFDVTVDPDGNIYIADFNNNVIRKVNTSGIISTYAGNGTGGLSGDGGPATSAQLLNPMGVTADINGNIYIADWLNNRVRKVSVSNSIDYATGSQPNYVGAGPDVYGYENIPIGIHAQGGISYTWTPSAYLDSSNVPNPNATVPDTTVFQVRILLPDSSILYDSLTVFIVGPPSIASGCGNIVINGNVDTHTNPCNTCMNQCDPNFTMPNNWTQPNAATDDYFNSCSPAGVTASANQPSTAFGTMSSVSGAGFLGLVGYAGSAINGAVTSSYDWTEYAQQHMSCALLLGQKYKVSMWVGCPLVVHWTNGNIGAFFSNGPITSTTTSHFTATPQVSSGNVCIGTGTGTSVVGTNTITNNSIGQWSHIQGTVTGASQNYITIGTFYSAPPNSGGTPTLCQLSTGNYNTATYYFYDDISVTPVPPEITTTSVTVCSGTTFSLCADGGANYSWSGPGVTGTPTTSCINVVAPTVTATTVFTYTVTTTLTCPTACSYSATTTVTVTPSSPISVNSQTICAGSTTTLTATGGTTYTWTPATGLSSTSGATVTASPASTTVYTVSSGSGSCTPIATSTVTVNPAPNLTVSSSTTICSGTATTLTVSGANSYSWTPSTGLSSTTGSVVTANPTTSTIYTVKGTVGTCTNSVQVTITVNLTPTVTVNSATVCAGSSTSITANGASTYTWTPSTNLSATTGSVVIATPPAPSGGTTNYTVIGTNPGGCSSSAIFHVTSVSLPNINASATNTLICSSSATATTVLHASPTPAFNGFSWSNPSGTTISGSTSANPTVTMNTPGIYTYTVTATNTVSAFHCQNTATVAVAVLQTPTVTVNSPNICVGGTVTLTASGATTYSWNPGNATGSTHTVNPNATSTYTVIGTLGACTNTAVSTVTVNSPPSTFTWSPPCAGITSTVNITPTQTSVVNYSWSPAVSCLNSPLCSQVVVTPTVGTSYTITATNSSGCTRTQTLTPKTPTSITITPTQSAFCSANSSSTFTTTFNTSSLFPSNPYLTWTAPSGGTFTCNPNPHCNSGTASVTGIGTFVYTVSTTAVNGCTTTKTVTLTVNPTPTIAVAASPAAVCPGYSTALSATGANTYTWTPNSTLSSSTGANVAATPTANTTYTTTGTDANGCVGSTTTLVSIIPPPSFTITPTPTGNCSLVASNTICIGSTATLTASDGSLNYTWTASSGGILFGNPVTVSPAVTTTYTVIGDNGSCSATQTTSIVVSSCSATGTHLPLNGTVTTGTFALNGSNTIAGTLTIGSGVVIQCGAGASLTVPPGTVLNLNGCHISTGTLTSTMWQGIIVAPGGTINTSGGTLIEDAVVAIDNNGSAGAPQSGIPPIINVTQTVFNCNRTGVREAFYQDGNNANYSTSSFNVSNSLFTCRCGVSFPISVLQVATLTNTVTGSASTDDLSNFYSVSLLQSGNTKAGDPSLEGIRLEDNGPAVTNPNLYVYTIAGGQFNIFDNLVYGIYDVNTNINVSKSFFQIPRYTGSKFFPTIGGYGISAINTKNDRYNQITATQNTFAHVVRGVHTINFFLIDISNNKLYSKQSIPTVFPLLQPPPGNYGIFAKTSRFLPVNINNNNIANINTCIHFVIDQNFGYNGGNGEFVDAININNNKFADQFPFNSYVNRYIGNAITVENVIPVPGTPGPLGAGSQISILTNTITNAFNGILAREHQYQEVRTESNIITLIPSPVIPNFPRFQYGIEHDNVIFNSSTNPGTGNDIYQNTVTGWFTTAPTNTATGFEQKRGIWNRFGANSYITCNNVSQTGRGFEFEGTQSGIFWEINQMNACGEGYALTNNGMIGQQGNGLTGGTNGASDNQWTSNGFADTYTDANSVPAGSRLYLRTGPASYVPANNQSNVGAGGTPYSSLSLITGNPASSYNCTNPPAIVVHQNNTATARTGQNNNTSRASGSLGLFESIVLDSLPYPTYQQQNTFINKNMVYRAIKTNPALLDSSSTLTNFYTSSSNSAWALFSTIDDSLNTGNYSYVNTLLNSYNPSFSIEQNYKRFYEMYIDAMTGNFSSSDTTDLENLASSCPMLNGTVVFSARSLHNSYYNNYKQYDDNCPQTQPTVSKMSSIPTTTTKKSFDLNFFPNPTTGTINIESSDKANHNYKMEVYDLSGRNVMKQNIFLENGATQFKLDAQNGVYMLYLYGNEGTTIYRIMINK